MGFQRTRLKFPLPFTVTLNGTRQLFVCVSQTQQITPQLALQVLLQFDKAINTALANRVRNRVNFRVSARPVRATAKTSPL